MRKYSVIIPVYNRPEEVDELLESLTKQKEMPYEVIVVDDGSAQRCRHIAEKHAGKLPVKYFYKENSGQGFSRNFGFEQASGDFFIIFDSDCIIPENYFVKVEEGLNKMNLDAFGGPDKARDDFTPIQKAISYAMTGMFTTGGIRGRKKHTGTFHPRSFNMGISREVYQKAGGYAITRMGEDIEYSIRIIHAGYNVGLIEEAFVYHKRRTSFGEYFKQLRFFGRARINVSRFYPDEIKLIHGLPAVFLTGEVFWLMVSPLISLVLFYTGFILNLIFSMVIFFDALMKFKSIKVSLLSVIAAYVQLLAYGSGIITEGTNKLLKG